MPSALAELVAEFDVLLGRAIRRGRLPLDDLLDTYTALCAAPAENVVDIEAVTVALRQLPEAVFAARQVLLVPALEAFGVQPSPHARSHFRCGRLDDGTLMAEAPQGRRALCDWATHLCVLMHESRRAQALLQAAATPGDATALSFEQMAFAWGCDAQSLRHADALCGGSLLTRLCATAPLPPFSVHASFAPAAQRSAAQRLSAAMVQGLAELGLADRPLHLWLGDGHIVDCLSPYSRELRSRLVAWGQLQNKTRAAAVEDDDTVYSLCSQFLRSDPRLRGEKDDAERSVGIYHFAWDPLPGRAQAAPAATFAVIDLSRIDAQLCDSRLGPLRAQSPMPVVLALQLRDSSSAAFVLEPLLTSLGTRIQGLTLLAEGQLAQPEASRGVFADNVVVPQVVSRLAGGRLEPLPGEGLGTADFQGLSTRPVRAGTVLVVPSLVLAERCGALQRGEVQPSALLDHSDAVLDVLHDATYQGRLSQGVTVSFAVLPLSAHGGASSLLRARSAVAIAALRRLSGPPAQPPPAPEPSDSRAAAKNTIMPRRSTSWALRLKA